jgi:hypothetical protein
MNNIYRSEEFEGPRAGARQPPPRRHSPARVAKAPTRRASERPARHASTRSTFDATSYFALASLRYARRADYLAGRLYPRAADESAREQLRRSIHSARVRQAWHAQQARDSRAVASLPTEVTDLAAQSLAAIRASSAADDAAAKRELAARAHQLLRAAGEALKAYRIKAAAVSCKVNL